MRQGGGNDATAAHRVGGGFEHLSSGDVLLMDRQCFKMKDPLSIGLCLSSKTLTKYDHVGMVYKASPGVVDAHCHTRAAVEKAGGYSPSGTYILEANVGGVTLRSLEARLQRTSSNEVAVRHLDLPLRDNASVRGAAMDAAVNDCIPFGYKTDLMDFLSLSLKPPDKLDRMTAAVKLRILQDEVSLIRNELRAMQVGTKDAVGDHDATLRRRLLSKLESDYKVAHHWLVQTYFPHAPTAVSPDTALPEVNFDANPFFVDGESKSGPQKGVFCSELIIAVWQRCGVLFPFPAATSYAPVDFDKWDDEFNFMKEQYGMGAHQVLYPAPRDPHTTERIRPCTGASIDEPQSVGPAFLKERLDVLTNMFREANASVEPRTLPGGASALLDLPSVVPLAWLVQSTTHYQLARDMPEGIMVVGTLFALVGFVMSPLQLRTIEAQLGMHTLRGGLWSLGVGLTVRSLAAAALQSWLTYTILQSCVASQPDGHDCTKVMRHSGPATGTTVDDRHPFYTTVGLLIGCGAIGGICTHALEAKTLSWHFGPDRPSSLSLRCLMRGASLSALCFTFSYGGAWLIWYECFGPLYFTTQTSVFRRRAMNARDDRWRTQQRDAMIGAMGITLLVETLTYPMQAAARRRWLSQLYHPDVPPVRRVKRFVGLGRHLLRSSAICAITGGVVWSSLL